MHPLRVKGCKKVFQAKWVWKQVHPDILMSDKTEVKVSLIRRNKKWICHYSQRINSSWKYHNPKHTSGLPNIIKSILKILNTQNNTNSTIVDNFNTQFSPVRANLKKEVKWDTSELSGILYKTK